MLIIDSTVAMARALERPIDEDLRRLLTLRRDQLARNSDDDLGTLALFIVVAPGECIFTIEAAAGYPVITTAAFEWVQRHGHWFEAVAILSDDGFATVLLVPDYEGVDMSLLDLIRGDAAFGELLAPPDAEAEQSISPPT